MKKSLFAAAILTLTINFSLRAEETYQAPRLKMKGAPGYKSVVVDSQAYEWESNYKVEEKVGAERSVASDKETDKKAERGPSSTSGPSAPATWLYERR